MDLNKFKELPLKKKIEWIIHYYGIWIIVGIIALFVVFNFLHSVLFPEPISDVCVIILSDDYIQDDAPKLEEEISALINGSVSVEIYNISDVYGNGAFSIKLLSNQVDLVVAPKEETDQMIESEYIEEYSKIDSKETKNNNSDMYVGITTRARKGEQLNKAYEYFINSNNN